MTKSRSTTTKTKRTPATRPRRSTLTTPRTPEEERASAETASRSLDLILGRVDEQGRTLTTKKTTTPSGAVRIVSVHVKAGKQKFLKEVRLTVKEGADVPLQDLVDITTTLGSLFKNNAEPRR